MPVGRAIFSVVRANEIGNELGGSTYNFDAGHEAVAHSQESVKANGGTVSAGPRREVPPLGVPPLQFAQDNILAAKGPTARMYIQSIDDVDAVVNAQFNPERLKESVQVNWNRFNIPGISHQPKHYGSTDNDQFKFELVFDAGATAAVVDSSGSGSGYPAVSGSTAVSKLVEARKQLLAWTVLRKTDSIGNIGDTNRLLFVWPNLISLTCNLVSIDFSYERFNSEGTPTYFRCDIVLEEARDVVVFSSDIMANGTIRSSIPKEKV